MYNCFIFDIDGTLINSEQVILKGLQHALKLETNQHIDLDDLRFAFGIHGFDALEQLGVENKKAVTDTWIAYTEEHYEEADVFPHIEEVLKTLQARDVILGVITSKVRSEYKTFFEPLPIADYMSFSVCAGDTDHPKPHPDPMYRFLEMARVKPDEAVYIGDSIYDMKCAVGANVDFALAGWGSGQQDFSKAAHVLTNPKDILKLL